VKIRKLQLKNIGVFDDETIEFHPCPAKDKAEIHIFTGQNGSGKSTILMALAGLFNPDFAHENHNKGFSTPFFKRFRHNPSDEKNFNSLTELNKHIDNLPDIVEGLFENNKKTEIKVQRSKESNILTTRSATEDYGEILKGKETKLKYAVFAYSGYRQIKSEDIEAIKEPKKFNPLSQSLEFVKDYSQTNQLSINQLIANNISKSAIEKNRSQEKSVKFANVIKSIEKAIFEITDWNISFDLETEPTNLITKINGKELDFDVLPDGLRSLISWIADLLGRVDLLRWQDDLPIFEKNLILLLDEIEVHLHPAWQRKVLPVVQKLFKNSQIFVSTHSPFVVNSVDDAWVYKLELENGKAKVAEIVESENSNSITQVLREIFDVEEWFGLEVQNKLDRFEELRDKILSNGSNEKDESELLDKARELAEEPNDQLKQIIRRELQQLSEIKNKPFTI